MDTKTIIRNTLELTRNVIRYFNAVSRLIQINLLSLGDMLRVDEHGDFQDQSWICTYVLCSKLSQLAYGSLEQNEEFARVPHRLRLWRAVAY